MAIHEKKTKHQAFNFSSLFGTVLLNQVIKSNLIDKDVC